MKKKTGYLIYILIGILFVFFCMTEHELAAEGNILWNGKWIGKLLAVSLILGSLLGSLIAFVLYRMEAFPGRENKRIIKKSARAWKRPGPRRLFGLSWLCTMLSWLPGFLAYYPGINAYDFLIQLGQMQRQEYNAHHPLAHTLLMEGFIRLGEQLGSGTAGMALYILVQMGILAAALAGGIALLGKWEAGGGWLIGLQVLASFLPAHWYMSISATKDTLFTAFMLLLLLMLCGRIGSSRSWSNETESAEAGKGQPGNRRKMWYLDIWDVGYILFGILMVLFRNNGIYAIAVMAVFFLLAAVFGKKARRLWIKILAETVVGLAAGSMILTVLFHVTGAVQGDKREMLSIPIQQLARTMVYHGGIGVVPEDDDTMEDADKALINEFILYEAYKNYRPDISDPVKGNTNTYVFVYRMKDFFKTYLGLLAEYPGDYVNAVLAVNAGYLSPFDESHAHINEHEGEVGLGYMQTRWEDPGAFGLDRESKWPWLLEKMEIFADENQYLNVPVLKYIMVPGTYLWLSLLVAAWLLIHKKYRLLLPFALILGYYVTLVLGPTVQLRYIYPVMTALPYLAAWALNNMSKEKEK